MSVSGLIFKGNVNGPGEWYGKIEQQGDKKTLVLFKRSEAPTAGQKLADKLAGVRKAGKLASAVVARQSVVLQTKMQDPRKYLLLSRYLESAFRMTTPCTRSRNWSAVNPTSRLMAVSTCGSN